VADTWLTRGWFVMAWHAGGAFYRQNAFMGHFGLGGSGVEVGWTEAELKAALIDVIEDQADQAVAAADAAPL
jgi:hypothetical protein